MKLDSSIVSTPTREKVNHLSSELGRPVWQRLGTRSKVEPPKVIYFFGANSLLKCYYINTVYGISFFSLRLCIVFFFRIVLLSYKDMF